jgi:hydroxyacylglutathione hydrolase
MFLQRFYDDWLAQASYLVGCQATGEAIVVDPGRVIEPYLRAAEAEDLRIMAVTETHIHADFLSGLHELAAATGARMYVSGAGPAEWQYAFRDDPNVEVIVHGAVIKAGNVELEAAHTPGHTPEHLSFLTTDRAATQDPMGIFTGDFVFVGDVGRPDLLEKAAHVENTAVAGARQLFSSLSWLRGLPDHLQIWPGHGAGSACGKGLGAVPQSTVGYERLTNWALGIDDEEELVRQVLAGQPDPPRYFGRMKVMNREGPPILGEMPAPPQVRGADIPGRLHAGALLVDTRPTARFAEGHLPGSINVPLGRSFTTYAGSVLPYDRDLILLLERPGQASAAVAACISIGLDRIAGVTGPDAVSGPHVATARPMPVAELMKRRDGSLLIDVRNRYEWEAGHPAGAISMPLADLADRIDDIPADADVVLVCQVGSRSAVAASLLGAHGRTRARNLGGGMSEWVASGGAVETS